MDKRGQGLSVNAIILIIIGLVILVILIVGFTMGWGKIVPWIKSTNNVKDISDACQLACSTQAKYSYCSEPRELKTKDVVLKDVNCNFLANIKTEYGIATCSAVECDNAVSSVLTEDGAKTECKGKNTGNKIEYLSNNQLTVYKCQENDISSSS